MERPMSDEDKLALVRDVLASERIETEEDLRAMLGAALTVYSYEQGSELRRAFEPE